MNTRPRAAIVLGAAVMTTLGCSGNPQPVATTPSASLTSPSASGQIEPASASGKDPRGDGAKGDITSVKLDRTDTALNLTVTLVKRLPTNGASGVFVNLSSVDGDVAMQAGVKWADGAQIAYFVFDSASTKQKNLPGRATVSGNIIKATFPVADLADLGNVWKWQVVTSVDGQDADSCPDPGDDPILNPVRGRLPSA
jgi:hypothetical protein